MSFPDIHTFPESYPGPYERQMGSAITNLLHLFANRVPDIESNTVVAELAATPLRWSAGHAVFDEVRGRLLAASETGDALRECQHDFEESCCKALYNACKPRGPFDPGSPFFVAPQALSLAKLLGIPLSEVTDILASSSHQT